MGVLQNSLTQLKAIEPEDLEILYSIETERCKWNTGTTGIPYSKYAIKEYLENQIDDIYTSRQLRLVIKDTTTKVSVGLVELYDFDPISKKAELGIAILSQFEKLGYARSALQQMIDFAKNTLQIHQLYAFVEKNNFSSIKLFSYLEFNEITTIKDWIFEDGKYQNVIFFQRFL